MYALIDPPEAPEGDLPVLLVSPDFETAVVRPLSEWKESEATPEETPAETSEEAPDTSAEEPAEGTTEESPAATESSPAPTNEAEQ
jgi:hypothetical protein